MHTASPACPASHGHGASDFEALSTRDYFGAPLGHATADCDGCHEYPARVEADGARLCLDCAGLSECDRCATVVPSAETCDDGICEACQLLAARRALLVVLARAASIAATGPRRVIVAEGSEAPVSDECPRCGGDGEVVYSPEGYSFLGRHTCPVCRGSALSGSGEARLRRAG